MAVIGWVDCGLRLSREPQEGKVMADTTETGRGSRPWEQGEVAKDPGEMRGTWSLADHRRAFVEGVAWWEFTKTGGTLWQSDRRLAEDEAERRFPDADPAPPERTCRWTCIPYVPYKSPAMWRAACKWEQPDFSSRPRGMYCPGCGGTIVQAGTKPDPVPAETRRTCKWTLTGDRWVAGCGSTPAPDIPPPTSCECGGLVITEEFSQSEKDLHGQPAVAQDDEPEWMQTLREQAKREYPPEYHYHGEIQLATAARSALAEIEAQEKEIARLTDLNTFFLSNALAIARGKKEE